MVTFTLPTVVSGSERRLTAFVECDGGINRSGLIDLSVEGADVSAPVGPWMAQATSWHQPIRNAAVGTGPERQHLRFVLETGGETQELPETTRVFLRIDEDHGTDAAKWQVFYDRIAEDVNAGSAEYGLKRAMNLPESLNVAAHALPFGASAEASMLCIEAPARFAAFATIGGIFTARFVDASAVQPSSTSCWSTRYLVLNCAIHRLDEVERPVMSLTIGPTLRHPPQLQSLSLPE